MNKIIILLIITFSYINAVTYEQASNYYKNKQYKESFTAYKELAITGNVNAQYNLGIFYYQVNL